MSYRDEKETLRRRIEALEAELSALRAADDADDSALREQLIASRETLNGSRRELSLMRDKLARAEDTVRDLVAARGTGPGTPVGRPTPGVSAPTSSILPALISAWVLALVVAGTVTEGGVFLSSAAVISLGFGLACLRPWTKPEAVPRVRVEVVEERARVEVERRGRRAPSERARRNDG